MNLDTVTRKEKKVIEYNEKNILNDIVSYLNGEYDADAFAPEIQERIDEYQKGRLVLQNTEYDLSYTFRICNPLHILGNNAKIIGSQTTCGFEIHSGNVLIEDLSINGFTPVFRIDPLGKEIQGITLKGIEIEHVNVMGMEIGSTVSNGAIKNLHIDGCTFRGVDLWQEDPNVMDVPINISAAFGDCDGDVSNCLLESVEIKDCRFLGGLRGGINLGSGGDSLMKIMTLKTKYVGNIVRDITFANNFFEECWEASLCITHGYNQVEKSIIEDIKVVGNTCNHGIAGALIFAAFPCNGDILDGVVRKISISGNTFKRIIDDVGEPVRGIFVGAGRADGFMPIPLEVSNCITEDIDIYDNTFIGGGIVLCGGYGAQDAHVKIENNVLRRVNVHDNKIQNADYAFTFEAAQLEGRRYDWNFGYPRHDKEWYKPLESDDEVLFEMSGNSIEDLTCENNTIDGYRYRVLASGADIRGHGVAKNNTVCKNIIFRNNTFGVGEGHVRVHGYIGEDFCIDGGGNEVDMSLKKR